MVVPLHVAMSHHSRSPFAGPPGPSAVNLAEDLERRLDLDDEDFSIINPSVVSSLAQLSARSSASARRGELSSVSLLTPRFPGGGNSGGFKAGPSSAPTKLGSSKLLKAVFIGAKELESLCLGHVGNKSRFCIARKIRGGSDCGVSSHRKSKMSVQVDTFWVPGGFILNNPTAKTGMCLPSKGLSEQSLSILTETLHTETRWVEQFKLIMERTAAQGQRRAARAKKSSGSRSSEVESVYSGSEAHQALVRGGSGGGGGEGGESEVDPDDNPMDDEMEIPVPEEVTFDPAEGWEVACEAMQEAINKMASTIASQARIIAQLQSENI